MQKKNYFGLFILASLLLSSSRGWAQSPQDQELTYKDIKFACTGVAESKEDPRWTKYPVKLMFTTAGRAYVTYVQVTIKDAQGAEVFTAECDSPWLVVDLKPGKYSITAVALHKYSKTASITAGGGKQAELAIRFPEITGE